MEQHSASVLMGTLVAVALRLLINATSIYSMTPLIQQYDSVAISLGREPTAMKSLIENLRKKVRQNMLQPITEGRVKPADLETNILATSAFAAWGQMLWEGRDAALDRTLSSEGVLPKLLTEDNNAHMIKRLLSLRTSLFGRNVQRGQIGALYLLLPPSPQTHRFGHELNVSRRHIIDFPDLERLLLLYVQHYIGEPLFIPEPLALPSGEGKNGSANALLQSPAAQNTQSTPQANGAASTTPPPTAKGSSVSKRARTPSQGDASSVQGTAQTAPQSNPNAETGTQATPVVNTSAQGTTSL